MPLVLIIVGIVLAVFLLLVIFWILRFIWALALAVITIWIGVSILIGAMLGVIRGAFLIQYALSGRITGELNKLASPDRVAAGTVIRGRPPKTDGDWPWDSAWANYFPYQLSYDLQTVIHLGVRKTRRLWPLGGPAEWGYFWNVDPVAGWAMVIYFLIRSVGLICYAAAYWAVIAFVIMIAQIARAITALLRGMFIAISRKRDTKMRIRNHALAVCDACYKRIQVPSYHCPSCGTVHRDLRPGPLGTRRRICQCREELPVGIRAASQELEAFCPHCSTRLGKGAGGRRTLVVPVFGAPSVGKTQLLAAMVNDLQDRVAATGSDLIPGGEAAARFLEVARQLRHDGRPANKTQHQLPPMLSYTFTHDGEEVEIKVVDPAGEYFVDAIGSTDLRYFDQSDNLVYIVDPFTLTKPREHIAEEPQLEQTAQISKHESNSGLRALMERLENTFGDSSTLNLLVVLSKAGIIKRMDTEEAIPTESDNIRDWIDRAEGFALLNYIQHRQFKTVEYLAVESRFNDVEYSPLQVLNWILIQTGAKPLEEPHSNSQEPADIATKGDF